MDENRNIPTLRRGAKGELVRKLQGLLNFVLGGIIPPLTVDGIFGAKTEDAVKEMQSRLGLTDDGICGPKTWAALDAAPRPKETYTVHIPGLDQETAESFAAAYEGAYITKE